MTNNEAKIKMQEVLKEVLDPITFACIKDELCRRLLDVIEFDKRKNQTDGEWHGTDNHGWRD
jgi:hypothetical protein